MLNSADLLGQGISFPPRIGADGRVTWSSGETNVRDSIRVILLTNQGERLRLPSFGAGLSRFFYEPNTVATRHLLQDRIVRALGQWEPRITVQSVQVDADPSDPQTAVATITYQLVATQSSERISLRVGLGG
jgi:uncharacterized protein